jgi:diguanylate cyclase (GGDEF)-like protein/PAS domain S-box-containing protein
MNFENLLTEEKIKEIVFKTLENSEIFCLIIDYEGKILYSNEGALKITDYQKNELIGKSIYSLLINASEIEKILKSEKVFKGFIQGKGKSGMNFHLYLEIFPIRENKKIVGFVYLGEKILGKEKLSKFSYAEEFDIITGLPHEKAFSTVITTHINRYNEPFVLLIVDICGFSDLSITYGIEFSEILLKKITERIKTFLPSKSFIAKTEADEFLIALFKTTKEKIATFISDFFEKFLEPFVINGKSIVVSFNIGISSFPENGKTYEELFNKAKIALERAKKKGENTFSVYEENLEKEIKNSIFLKERLANLLKGKEIILYGQPYFSTSNKEISGIEVLLRIRKNEKVESIATIIDFLENSGLILKIEDFLFEEIKKIGTKIKIPLSINLSAKSFLSSEIFSKLAELRRALNYPFICEITERLFLEREALEIIKKIKELDIKIAIDDFGTGYSSLSYIENLPIDIIKIDYSFIKRMLDEPKALAIVQTIIDLAKKLGIKTLAEGVENEEQLRILRLLMCDFVQGYYLSEPVPIEDFTKMDEGK